MIFHLEEENSRCFGAGDALVAPKKSKTGRERKKKMLYHWTTSHKRNYGILTITEDLKRGLI